MSRDIRLRVKVKGLQVKRMKQKCRELQRKEWLPTMTRTKLEMIQTVLVPASVQPAPAGVSTETCPALLCATQEMINAPGKRMTDEGWQ